jgi:branched-subunit amino acid transport protein
MTEVVALLTLALASWVLRIGLVVLVPASRLPDTVRSSLDHLAPAVLAAILVLDLVGSVGASANAVDGIATLAAAAVIGGVAWRTRNLALTAIVALAAVVTLDLILA